MRKHVQRRHDAHVRAHSVCTEHSALLDAAAGGQKTRDTLSAQVADVDRLLALQERSIEDRRAATEQGRLSRQGLRDAANLTCRAGWSAYWEHWLEFGHGGSPALGDEPARFQPGVAPPVPPNTTHDAPPTSSLDLLAIKGELEVALARLASIETSELCG